MSWLDDLVGCISDEPGFDALLLRIAKLRPEATRKAVTNFVLMATLSEWEAERPIRYDLAPQECA